jgi:hypothetical protein
MMQTLGDHCEDCRGVLTGMKLVRGDQLYDILYMTIFAFAAWVVNTLNAGVIYFWMKVSKSPQYS